MEPASLFPSQPSSMTIYSARQLHVEGKIRILVVILVLALQACTTRCCLEHEKAGLHRIKSYFVEQQGVPVGDYGYPGPNDTSEELSSWGGDEENCCLWKRVECSRGPLPLQHHVTHLSLNSLLTYTNGSTLNVTLFRPFDRLISLDLSDNYIANLVGFQGNKTSSTLRHIEILNFTSNELDLEGVMDFVGSLTTLKQFLFGYNPTCTELGFQGISRLKRLQVLDCSYCNSYMDSADANLTSQVIANMTSLRVLDLSYVYRGFVGSWNTEGLCNLRNLQELKLPGNNLVGIIPKCLWNLTSLQILDLSGGNSFTGNVPSSINLPSLRRLSIRGNNFKGKTSLNPLMNNSRLEVLLLSNNNELEVEIGDSSRSTYTTKLLALGLSHCNLTGQAQTFVMKILSYQSSMEHIELSSNGLTGSFPTWLLHNNSNLKHLDLGSNLLSGSFQLPNHSNLALVYLDISSNNFSGRLPDHTGMALSSLKVLNMSLNSFEGSIPPSIGNLTQLLLLDLSSNNISGEVPRRLFSDCTELRLVLLSKNNLRGEIIPSYMNLMELDVLKLDNNHFGGTMKESIQSSGTLSFLDISNNNVAGKIPGWISNLYLMETLSLAGNQFHGEIPSGLCDLEYLGYLDLSENRLTGRIASCGNLEGLRYLHMHGNSLVGDIPEGLANCSQLVTLDLRNNKLSGGVPSWIGSLSNLVVLLLGGNQLGGGLPVQLCLLQNVNIFDLSNNNISGALPSCLQNLSFGSPENATSGTGSAAYPIYGYGFKSYISSEHIDMQGIQEEADFIAKNTYKSYGGKVLSMMSELDLSGNKLTGRIPPELGKLGLLHGLNLSHNRLSGPIPTSFSKLKSVESLDLSSNNLSGSIPWELVELTFLEIFNVAYNNLSGQVPETAQFGTFNESIYQGNPLLCGSRLPRSCGMKKAVPVSAPTGEEGDEGFDMEAFLWSFGVSCIMVLGAFFAVLAINPYWRRAWFAYIDLKFLWWFHP